VYVRNGRDIVGLDRRWRGMARVGANVGNAQKQAGKTS
jgi:hypothetical protein